MSWYPSGLDPIVRRFAEAIDKRFQPINPNGPVKIPAYTSAQLTLIVPSDFVVAMNTTTGKPVFSVQSGTVFVWRYADGTAAP